MTKIIYEPWQRTKYNGKGTITCTSFKTFTQTGGTLCLKQSNPSLKLFSGKIINIKIP